MFSSTWLSLAAIALSSFSAAAYTASPRWGQATVLVEQGLFIHGGKTDQFNSISYDQAPNTNDVLYLDLSSPFNTSSIPWDLVSSSSLSSSSQGPSIAWHTVSAINTTLALSFGGQLDANSPNPLPEEPDSSWLLDLTDFTSPLWISEMHPYASEPLRRIHHTSNTLSDGRVLIIGGLKTDGSGTVLSDNYLFDISPPVYIPFNSTGEGPPAIYGHASVVTATGKVVVFGGYTQGSANLFTTIWILSVQQQIPFWFKLTISSSNIPGPRMGFAVALLPDGRILIHGGYDIQTQSTFSDGWILSIDFSSNSAVWTSVDALSQLGARRDHFAVPSGDQVIFGFGYGSNGPAPAGIQVYNPSSSSFPPSYTPPPPSSTTSATLPGTSHTATHTHGSITGTTTSTGSHPTDTSVSGGGDSDGGGHGNSHRTTVIAVSTAFGVLALLAAGCAAGYYIHKRRQERFISGQFSMINGGDDEEDSPHFDGPQNIPPAGPYNEKNRYDRGKFGGVLTSFGLSNARRNGRDRSERRNMLADEDTRQFGANWSNYSGRNRDGSSGSAWSLRDLLSGVRGRMTREASYVTHASAHSRQSSLQGSPWQERGDPFSDGAALLKDEETGYVGAVAPAATAMVGAAATSATTAAAVKASRPRGGGRLGSYSSAASYTDPFSDPEPWNAPYDKDEITMERRRRPVPPPPISTMATYPLMDHHTLSPLSETTSRLSLTDPALSSQSSQDHHSSSFTSHTNATSYEYASPRPTSIIDAGTSRPVQRSDSWWNRFSRTSFLERRGSTSRQSKYLDLRDPNPPPSRLVAIEEKSGTTGSPDDSSKSTPGSAGGGRKGSKHMYNAVVHGKSSSSIRTANTDAIERIGAMDVVQRGASGSQHTRSSIGSTISTNISTDDGHLIDPSNVVTSPVQEDDVRTPMPSISRLPPDPSSSEAPRQSSSSPVHTPSSELPVNSSSSNDAGKPVRSPGRLVASRVNTFEQQLAREQEVLPPTNTKAFEERVGKRKSVTYGLVPRASLYVANPDRGASGDSR